MPDPVFALDANVFIQANRQYYPFDLAPGFWASLVRRAEEGRVESIDRVRTELERGVDELVAWARGPFASAFASTDAEDVLRSYGELMNWAHAQQQFSDAAKADFARSADGWLVAYARARQRIVVTQEVFNPDVRRKIPIPNVCRAFGVSCINTYEMMRRLGIQWG